MKTRKVFLPLAAALLVVALAFGAYQSAYAQGDGFDPWNCGGGGWFGFPCKHTATACNPLNGEVEEVGFMFAPGDLFGQMIIDNFGPDMAECGQGTGMKETGKCKLTDIDDTIYLGTPFEAKWLGRGGYLRFIKPSGEFNYIAKVDVTSGTVMQDGNEYVGMFSARGVVEPGVYTVNCFGPGGTAGLGIKNVEIVGH